MSSEIPVNRRCFRPVEGNAFNPLLQFPRNHPCICGSGAKFKACCLRLQPRGIPKSLARRIIENWDRLMSGALQIQPPKPPETPQPPPPGSVPLDSKE